MIDHVALMITIVTYDWFESFICRKSNVLFQAEIFGLYFIWVGLSSKFMLSIKAQLIQVKIKKLRENSDQEHISVFKRYNFGHLLHSKILYRIYLNIYLA